MNIVTIMNFIRGVEPRNPNLDLLEPVKRQMELNEKYGFDNTFLLQYDALINPTFSELFTKAPDSRREIGVWIEIVRPLTEKVGIKWRGRPGYDWDWYVDPGFLPAYTKEEKKLLLFRSLYTTISSKHSLSLLSIKSPPNHNRSFSCWPSFLTVKGSFSAMRLSPAYTSA